MALPTPNTTIPFTEADYLSLPDGGPRYELIEGELELAPAPNRRHQEISANLEFLIRLYLQSHPIGKLYDAPFDLYLTDLDVLQPDLAFFGSARAGILSARGAEGGPDLVVEILSPASQSRDRGAKQKVYTRCGVTEYWIADPGAETIEVYRLQEDPANPVAVVRNDGGFLESALLPGLRLPLAKVFAD